MKKTILIGEIGINHNGDLKLAKKIILEAKRSGFDFVKFQKRNPAVSTPTHKMSEIRNTPWGNITYLEYKKKIEFGLKEYDEINLFCKKIKIKWFASAWDKESLIFLKKYKLIFNKVPSAMLTNFDLVKEIAKEKKITFISTGMSTYETIDKVIKIFKKYNCKFILMHCVSCYPAQLKDLNLKMISELQKKYKSPVGYSGHEKSVSPSIFAKCLGAVAIERHITIDRTLWGTDQSASLEPNGMKNLVDMVKRFEISFGNGKKKFLHEEKKKLKDMKYW
jgi:N-acetylneuraminate synthase